MDGEAGWWTTSGNIGLPPLARAMGVGRQQQHVVVSVAVDDAAAIVVAVEVYDAADVVVAVSVYTADDHASLQCIRPHPV